MASFQTCENHGDAIVVYPYGYREKCPCCEAIAEKESVESELEQTKVSLETANETIEELNADIKDLQEAAPENSGGPAN
jgi:hypothetical protein